MRNKGFTLLEMMVSLAIFSIISLMAIGASVSMFGHYGNTQDYQILIDNLNFAVEAMTRDVRFGSNYRNYSSGDSITVDFKEIDDSGNSEDLVIEYSLNDKGRLMRQVNKGDKQAVTSEGVHIETFKVHVSGVEASGHPKATFFIEGVIGKGDGQTDFVLQTTVSQRANENTN